MHDGTPDFDRFISPVGRTAISHAPIVVYTAITADYDDLKEQPCGAADGATFVAFLDAVKESATWRSYPIHSSFDDPVRNAKIHKVLPHLFFPNARYSLWIDGSVTILFDHGVERLVDRYLADRDLVVFPHRKRTCVYQEASVCLQLRLDEPEVVWQQVCRYTDEGYPANAGLGECSVILRRHSDAVRAFNEVWWEEITRGSRRDQLSFDYAARKVGLRYGLFPGTISETRLFRRSRHAAPDPQTAESAATASPAADLDVPERRRFYRSVRPAAGRARKTIAFGRVRDKPSWSWVGFDVARELSRHYDVVLYDTAATPPDCDVLFMIKKRPTEEFCLEARRRGTRLVYCPIDAYRSREEIEQDADLLRSCALVIVHCERLLPLVRAYGANAHFAEHHTRYGLGEMAKYRDQGFILWIGSAQYVPYLSTWLESHPIGLEIKILTDIDNDSARAKARMNAAELGVDFVLAPDTKAVAGCRIYRWSERRQQEMMQACRAAMDVKMTQVFNQHHKPPTKAQQYVASGIPFAVNPESYSAEYFRVRGFDVASPLEGDRWLSHEYWQATRAAAHSLRAATSIEVVAARHRELIETL